MASALITWFLILIFAVKIMMLSMTSVSAFLPTPSTGMMLRPSVRRREVTCYTSPVRKFKLEFKSLSSKRNSSKIFSRMTNGILGLAALMTNIGLEEQ